MFGLKLCFYQRLAISLVVVFSMVLSIFFAASVHLQRVTQNEAEQRLHLNLAEHLVQDNPLLQTGVYDYEALKNLFHTLMVMGPNFEFYYLDPNGKVLTYSSEFGPLARDQVELEPILEMLDGSAALPLVGQDPRDAGGEKIFSVAPVYNSQGLQGYIYVIIGGQVFDSIIAGLNRSSAMQQFGLFAVAALIFLLVALLVLFKNFTRPMKILSDDMDRVRAADFDKSVMQQARKLWKRESHNEVHRLGCAFNDMLEHIDTQFERLQQTDIQRRILLADLSHDLRTPLANLQGYIETLDIHNDTLSSDERKRFVDISLKNARNLKHLIDQIFELAYLEAGQVTMSRESFSLGELIHDVSAKFAMQIEAKSLTMNIEFGQQDVFVNTDIGKLERVLTNLIDNAIRHTDSGGTITLAVIQNDNTVRVEIKDTGNGISQNELAFIFDARYQASNQCKDSKIHAGLGLAICKKLTQLLNSELSVTSEVGKGTCFSLNLALESSPSS
ncbi:ATP-binding protein [Alteromonas sp. ASW11-36]|uniref:histidine kinase n=1 Tax=Alteromonas arenosi TaxID=3055817 RepID=A0ABT7T172_9ALTE|nr:ATP-binding protein [Alteromonas sp. ASW11-36]MDM7861542.1 ATP-binding protein [Alteromonas sp. ASW11-36]